MRHLAIVKQKPDQKMISHLNLLFKIYFFLQELESFLAPDN